MKDVRKEIQNDHKRLLENMMLLQKIYSVNELAEALGVSRNTWTNRMKQPWRDFSYDDFRSISRYCNIYFTALMDGELKIGGVQ